MENHWQGYVKALGEAKVMPSTTAPSVAPYLTSSNATGVTGFFDLHPKNPEIQARYDAMQGSWEGVSASDSALANGLFRTESMPINQKYPFGKNK